jgi:hypothetical protein
VNAAPLPAVAAAAARGPAPGRAVPIPAEILASHDDLSPLSARFLQFTTEHPEAACRLDFRASPAAPAWARTYPYELQTWPTWVGAAKLAQLEHATLELARLVKSIPERIFGGDALRICQFYGWRDELLVKLLLEPPNGVAASLARCDLVDDGSGLKCLELNMSGFLGGWQHRFFEQACRSLPSVAAFLEREAAQPVHRDSWREALAFIVDHGCRQGHDLDGRFNVAVVLDREEPGWGESLAYMNDLFQDVLRASGTGCAGEIVQCFYPEDLAARGGALHRRQTPISAVIEYTTVATPRDVYRCFKSRRLEIFNGPLSSLLGDKRNLALLSQHEDSDLFSATERSFIRRHVPWSREVVDHHTTYRGDTVSLLDFAVARRDSLVLKAAVGARGIDVHLGANLTDGEWRRLLHEAAGNGTMLLQELVVSRPYMFQYGDRGSAPHQVVWGTFCFGDRYGGGFLRMLPLDRGPEVINSARGATEGLIFEV